jgi:CRISPR-associated protein Csm1
MKIALALGGLLHDIGKVFLRVMKDEEIRSIYSAIAREFDYKEEFGYAHAYNTSLFFKKFKIEDPIILSSAYHHAPEKAGEDERVLFAKIYQQADWLASSERSQKERKEKAPLLRSIFQNISLNGNNKESLKNSSNSEYYYDLAILSFDKDLETIIFPKKGSITDDEIKGKYQELLNGFEEEFKSCVDYLNNRQLEHALNVAYHLIYKYFWCVPASIYDKDHKEGHYPDISLFDHLRLTSAFASSLCSDENFEVFNGERGSIENELRLVFVKGDVSGIQDFLDGIKNIKGVAKRLR